MPTFGASNYPLRGGKNTLFEGGTKSPTIVSGGAVRNSSGFLGGWDQWFNKEIDVILKYI